jgi:energy-coupling factor transporter ATP-binding protein EcfA2
VHLAVERVFSPTESRAKLDARTQAALELVGTGHALPKRPHEISGGMKQRVGIARALAMEPKVLLMDEPLGAPDALTRAHRQDELGKIVVRTQGTVVMVTHDVDEAVLLSDRIVMMTNGPAATIGEILHVDLPQPRNRVELAEDSRYVHCRKVVLDFRYTRHGLSENRPRDSAAMKTFIRVVESSVPSSDRSLLEFGGGIYGQAMRFGAASRSIFFARGQGLPGQAWEQRWPIVLTRSDGSYFQRTRSAQAEGLTCGIAVSIFACEFLTSAHVMFCSDDEAHAEAFEHISRRTSFRKGSGLPGLAWGSGLPVSMEDLGKGSRFLRAETATKVDINCGFAMPCQVPDDESHAMAFLSALGSPTMRRFESWEPDRARSVVPS